MPKPVKVHDPFMPWPYTAPYGEVIVMVKRKYTKRKSSSGRGKEKGPGINNYASVTLGRYLHGRI